MFADLVRRYYAQRHLPGTLTINVADQNGQAVDLTDATEIKVYVAHEGIDWTDLANFTSYTSLGASPRVTTGSAIQGEVYFAYNDTILASRGQYRLSTAVIDVAHPSGSLYPEFAWDKITVFDDYGKEIQQLIETFRTNLAMWSSRYGTVFTQQTTTSQILSFILSSHKVWRHSIAGLLTSLAILLVSILLKFKVLLDCVLFYLQS